MLKLLLCVLLQLLLCAIAATPLRPVHLLPLVKGRNNESSPKLRVYGVPNCICRPRDHLFSMQSFFHRSTRTLGSISESPVKRHVVHIGVLLTEMAAFKSTVRKDKDNLSTLRTTVFF